MNINNNDNYEKLRNRDFIKKYNNFLINNRNERTRSRVRNNRETEDTDKNNTKTKTL